MLADRMGLEPLGEGGRRQRGGKEICVGVYVQVVIGLMLVFLMVFRPQGLFGNKKEMALDGH